MRKSDQDQQQPKIDLLIKEFGWAYKVARKIVNNTTDEEFKIQYERVKSILDNAQPNNKAAYAMKAWKNSDWIAKKRDQQKNDIAAGISQEAEKTPTKTKTAAEKVIESIPKKCLTAYTNYTGEDLKSYQDKILYMLRQDNISLDELEIGIQLFKDYETDERFFRETGIDKKEFDLGFVFFQSRSIKAAIEFNKTHGWADAIKRAGADPNNPFIRMMMEGSA